MNHDKPSLEATTKDIERTREQMSATIGALERLGPARAKEIAEEQIRAAKAAIHEEIAEAKATASEQLHEAKEMIAQGLSTARQAVKSDLQSAITSTKQSMRDATIGRVEDFATEAGDFMNMTKDSLVATIRQNPVPAALAGIGIAWLLMNRSKAEQERWNRRRLTSTTAWQGIEDELPYETGTGGQGIREELGGAKEAAVGAIGSAKEAVGGAIGSARAAVGGTAQRATEAVRGAAQDATETVRGVLNQGADAVGHAVEDARQVAQRGVQTARAHTRRAERAVENAFEANPIGMGALALAAGAALGYALPRTEKEAQLMGEVGQRVRERASRMGEGIAQQLQQVAGEAGSATREATKEAAKDEESLH